MVLASQDAFRQLMWALARPGLPQRLAGDIDPPPGLDQATAIALLTLADFETPVWLPPRLARDVAGDYLRFHSGCPLVSDPAAATFAVLDGRDAVTTLPRLAIGEDRYPDRSATVFIELPALDGGLPVRLTGPGIEDAVEIAPGGVDRAFWSFVEGNHGLYPLGVDIYLTAADRIIGLPRSTAISVVGG